VSTGCSGALPSINGEFLLTLATPLAPNAPFLFAVATETNSSEIVKVITLSLQPLCTQAAQCAVGNHVGSPIIVQPTTVSDSCEFTATITAGFIPGGANPISGAAVAADLDLTGTIESTDFYCGTAGGTLNVDGALVSANGSTFGAKSMPTGTMGASLPSQRPSCDPR
jgi:hypothetical protein